MTDVSAHGFWNWGSTAVFDIRIIKLDMGSYLCTTPEKALANTEKEYKDLYLQDCLERRRTYTPMVYSANVIPGEEALSTQKRLSALLSYKLKREYSEMCCFVKVSMPLAIVRSNSLLLHGPWGEKVRIPQRPELMDMAVMSLIAPWQG